MKMNTANQILCGDCLTYLSDNSCIPDASVDLIVTSPPYADRRSSTYRGIHPNEYVDWFLPIAKQLHRVLKPKGSFVLNIKERAVNGERRTYVIELILEMKKQGFSDEFRAQESGMTRKEFIGAGEAPVRRKKHWESDDY